MVEAKDIQKLTIQEYEKRTGVGFAGENSILRPIDPHDLLDMQRMKDMRTKMDQTGYFDRDEVSKNGIDFDLIEWVGEESMGEKHIKHGLLEWVKEKDPELEGVLFGVAGNKGVTEDEKGELQGWIYVVPAESNDLKVIRNAGIVLPSSERGQKPLYIAYIKHPDAVPHQMASALRQVCLLVSQGNAEFHKEKEALLKPPKNAKEQEKADLRFSKPRQVVYASIDIDNIGSQHMAESAGFVKVGKAPSTVRLEEREKTGEGKEDYIYVLDWDKLHEIVHTKSDKEFLEKFAKETQESV